MPDLIPIYPAIGRHRPVAARGRRSRGARPRRGRARRAARRGARGRGPRSTLGQALRWIHRPDNWGQKVKAADRLKFDEAFVTQTVLAQRRAAHRGHRRQPATRVAPGDCSTASTSGCRSRSPTGSARSARRSPPTSAQGHPMHRLLQGEVGSGKTVVALRAMLQVVDSGGQAALLAPTEVLAQQHHRSIVGDARRPGRGRLARRRRRRHPGGPAHRLAERSRAPRGAARGRRRRGRHRDRHPRAARGARSSSPTSAWSSSTSSTGSASSSGPR